MKVDTYQCDGCRIQKKETNHWFRGYKLLDQQSIAIVEWNGTPPSDEVENSEAHLCGASCVTEWVSKTLFG